jgi:hypothetical protein
MKSILLANKKAALSGNRLYCWHLVPSCKFSFSLLSAATEITTLVVCRQPLDHLKSSTTGLSPSRKAMVSGTNLLVIRIDTHIYENLRMLFRSKQSVPLLASILTSLPKGYDSSIRSLYCPSGCDLFPQIFLWKQQTHWRYIKHSRVLITSA